MQDNKDELKKNDIDDNSEFAELAMYEKPGGNISKFFILSVATTVGVMLALGLSFSAIKFMNSNETINTIISRLTGDDNEDKYIITFVENIGDTSDINQNDGGSLYIANASFYKGENGGKGEVLYFGKLLLTTSNTFESVNSKIIYELTIVNSTLNPKTFYGLNFNPKGNIKYTIQGIKEGDIIQPGQTVKTYVVVEYDDKDGKTNPNDFPKTVESSISPSFEKDETSLHIEKAEYYKSTNGGSGEVEYFSGMMLITKTTLNNKNSSVTYKIELKNDSSEIKKYNGLNYIKNPNVNYKVEGIKEGTKINPGQTVIIYLTISGTDDATYPITVESSLEPDFSDFIEVNSENGINLINQFPIKDEVGKKYIGKNYVYTFSFLVGRKTVGAYYEITAVPNSDNTLDSSYVKVYLEKNGQGVDLSYRNNGRVKVFSEYLNSEKGAEGKVIYKGTVTEEEAQLGKIEFVMRMWVSEDVQLNDDTLSNFVERKFGAKVNTYVASNGN